MQYFEETLDEKQVYKGNIIDVSKMWVKLPNGKTATRDIVRHPGAAAVIPLNADNEIYLVKQYRKTIDKVTIEIPAGKLDNGEDPLECAKRELKEETGLEYTEIKHVLNMHTSAGFSDEILYIYLATGLTEGETCADEDEFISNIKLPVNTLVEMITSGEITDSKTIVGILIADKVIKREI